MISLTGRTACALGLIALVCSACGEEEEPQDPLPPQERCIEEGYKAYVSGSIEDPNDEEGSANFDITNRNEAPGRILIQEIRIDLGTARPPGKDDSEPVILRLFDPYDGTRDFGVLLDELTQDGPLILDVIDASDIGAGSEDQTSLSDFDCAIEDDSTICAQIGFDSSGNQLLGDDDEYVFNASSGTVTIDGFERQSGTFHVFWDLELGRNVLRFGDESTGQVQGCLRPDYNSDDWTLQ